jgi:hypothetical protein
MDINNDKLEFDVWGQEHISVKIYQANGTVVLVPERNWAGEEILMFSASDGVFKAISASVTVSVMEVNDAPYDLDITAPSHKLKIKDGTSIDFSGECQDLDLIYGDKLYFRWSSSIDGKLGEGENLPGITLTSGKHIITLEVTDSNGASVTGTINVTVEQTKQQTLSEDLTTLGILISVLSIVIIVVLIMIFMFQKKKRKREEEERKEKITPVTVLPPTPAGQAQPIAAGQQIPAPSLQTMAGAPPYAPQPTPWQQEASGAPMPEAPEREALPPATEAEEAETLFSLPDDGIYLAEKVEDLDGIDLGSLPKTKPLSADGISDPDA